MANGTATADPGSVANPAPEDEAIYAAFLIGWLIVELKSRVRIAFDQSTGPNSGKGFGLQMASQWRALFTRIANLQESSFPNSDTAASLYDPPILGYLHPAKGTDYADIGIRLALKDGAPILPRFKLYEETRRAINSLSLLYVDSDESLIPDAFEQLHHELISAVLGDAPSAAATPDPEAARTARTILTTQAVKFLNAWDGFLRENYFAGGMIPDDDLELVAYNAGFSMSGLSWCVSAATIKLEDILDSPNPSPDEARKNAAGCLQAWQNVFRQQDVIRLQHQISALSSVLDDCYYEAHNDVKRPDEEADSVPSNPDLPSQSILAVKHSIDYWQRAIEWIGEQRDSTEAAKVWTEQDELERWRDLRLALTEQTNIWQTLITRQQSLRAFNLESVTRHIMKAVTDRIQSSLHQDFKLSMNNVEAAMQEVADDVKRAVGGVKNIAEKSLEQLIQGSKATLYPIFGIIIVVGAVLAVMALQQPSAQTSTTSGVAGGAVSIITAVLGFLHLGNASKARDGQVRDLEAKSKEATDQLDAAPAKVKNASQAAGEAQEGGLMSRIENAADDARSTVMNAFQKGYAQIRIELGALNRSTAVAYPLVEFFVTEFLHDEEIFLEQIIWNGTEREEEIQRVVSAAFGPLAVFMSVKDDVKPQAD